MAQNVGQSRGSQKHKQFVQDSANSYVVDAFKDMSEVAPGSPVDGEGYIVSNVGSIHTSWGTITGLTNGDIIRWRQSKLAWQIVMKAVVANQGFKAFVKDEDTLYILDSTADWIIASGSGGGVKNFAQKQAGAYKPTDWIKGNSGIFGAAGTLAGVLETETVAPLDGKKSFKYTTAAGSGNDWFYLLVDISEYARGGVIAFTFDYQWDGDQDISVHIWDASLTNQYSTELNLVKNTTNDNKLSRNSRTIYAHPDTESQVIVGFQINASESAGKTFIWDNLKVTDDIGVIGSGGRKIVEKAKMTGGYAGYVAGTQLPYLTTTQYIKDGDLATITNNSTSGISVTALKDCVVEFNLDGHDTVSGSYWGVSLNATNLNSTIAALPINERMLMSSVLVATPIDRGTGTVRFPMKAGDIARVHGTTTYSMESQSSVHITVEGEEEALRFLQVPNGEKLKDTFGALVYPATGTVAYSDYDFIQSVTIPSNRRATVFFKPGFFQQTPNIIGIVDESNNSISLTAYGVTTTEASFLYSADTGADAEPPIRIFVQKRSSEVPDIIGVPVSIQGQTHEQDSCIRVVGGIGEGSVANAIRTFGSLTINKGSAITYVSSAVNGDSFIVNESGIYNISYTDSSAVNANHHGITRNETSLTTAINGLPIADRILAYARAENTSADYPQAVSWSGYLNAGDVIRAQTDGSYTTWTRSSFTIAKVGTQPLLDGGVVKKPDTSWRVDSTGVTVDYVPGTAVVQFSSTTVENRGNGVEWDPSISSYRILKDGIYSFNAHVQFDNVGNFGISLFKNTMSTFGSFAASSSFKLTETYLTQATFNPTVQTSWSGYLTAGEYVNVVSANNQSLHSPGQTSRSQFSVACVGEIEQYTSRVYKEDPIAWQKKTLNSNLTVTSSTEVTDLRFNNLEVGKTYRISGQWRGSRNNNTSGTSFNFSVGGVCPGIGLGYIRADFLANDLGVSAGINHVFTATADGSLNFYVTGGAANVTLYSGSTFIILEELPFHAETSKWS